MNEKDYYQTIGVNRSDSPKKIKEAYRKLAFQYHPDRNKDDPAAAEKMKEINEAYATLSDTKKRAEYDRFRDLYGSSGYDRFRQAYSQQDIFRGSDIGQIFDEFARTFGFRSSEDIFKQFYGQGYQTFEFRRPGFYSRGFMFTGMPGRNTGDGSQKVNSSQHLSYLDGLQSQGLPGKLIKFFLGKVLGVQLPERGRNWEDTVAVTPQQAVQGIEIEYHYKKWGKPKNLMVKVPAGTRNGQRIKLRGMGGTGKGGGGAGDLYLKVIVKTPPLGSIRAWLKRTGF
jgi:DnaJ-class molecular chaperone